jgi:hypothetical protein
VNVDSGQSKFNFVSSWDMNNSTLLQNPCQSL